MDKDFLLEKIETARQNRFLNNFYSSSIIEKADNSWFLADNLLVSYNDHGVERLVFFVESWKQLDILLDNIEKGSFFLEYITRNPNEYIPAGSEVTARMMRLANVDCSSFFKSEAPVLIYNNTAIIEEAKPADADEINSILWETFHTEISHLLNKEELVEKIKAGQFLIHRDESHKIDALLQSDVMPKRFYINQIVNKTERNVAHALLLTRLKPYVENGGKYIYAWVDERNIASLKFHAKYGMQHDGMWSMIFHLCR